MTFQEAIRLSMTSKALYTDDTFWVQFFQKRPSEIRPILERALQHEHQRFIGILTGLPAMYFPDKPATIQGIVCHHVFTRLDAKRQSALLALSVSDFSDKREGLQAVLYMIGRLKTDVLQRQLLGRHSSEFVDKRAGLQMVLEFVGMLHNAQLQEDVLDLPETDFTNKREVLQGLLTRGIEELLTTDLQLKLLALPNVRFLDKKNALQKLVEGPVGMYGDSFRNLDARVHDRILTFAAEEFADGPRAFQHLLARVYRVRTTALQERLIDMSPAACTDKKKALQELLEGGFHQLTSRVQWKLLSLPAGQFVDKQGGLRHVLQCIDRSQIVEVLRALFAAPDSEFLHKWEMVHDLLLQEKNNYALKTSSLLPWIRTYVQPQDLLAWLSTLPAAVLLQKRRVLETILDI